MYKKILVPLDGSKRAEEILPHVEKLARKFNALIILLHVIEPHYLYTNPHRYILYNVEEISHEANTKEAKLYLARLEGEFYKKDIKVKSFVEDGPITETILNVARREEANLITMSSHGRTGLSKVFYGSVAASLLHLIDRPLLLVRAKGKG